MKMMIISLNLVSRFTRVSSHIEKEMGTADRELSAQRIQQDEAVDGR